MNGRVDSILREYDNEVVDFWLCPTELEGYVSEDGTQTLLARYPKGLFYRTVNGHAIDVQNLSREEAVEKMKELHEDTDDD